jgi:lysophospholipase L1-like esterase
MHRREFLQVLGLLGLSSCIEEEIMNKKILTDWWSGGSFNIDPYMDLINLQSDSSSYFTLSGSNITEWAEISGTKWTQSTSANRPLLTDGIPIFDGSNDQLLRASEISATTFSLYIVFKDTGAITKILLAANTNSDYIMHDAPSSSYDSIQMATGGVARERWVAGITGNRYSILSIRRNGNTLSAKINDRTLLTKTSNFAGQATLIYRLMGFVSGGFNMAGGVKAVCMSSQNLSESINTSVINSLYSNYNLSSDTATENICGFGDSNTVGQGVTSYLRALSSSLNVADLNLGISGTRLTSGTNNGISRWESQIVTRPYTDYVVLQYGTNDILNSVTASTAGSSLETIVSGLIGYGYNASKICICSPPYQQSGANATTLSEYNTAYQSIATTYNTKFFDLYTDIKDNGGDTLLSDSVHLNASGQTRWQNGVYTALTT